MRCKPALRMYLIIILAMLSAAVSAQISTAQPSSIEIRLQQLEDRESIRELLMEYGRSLDARDFAAFAALYTADGEWIGGFGRLHGPAAIQAEMENRIGTAPQQPGSSNHHIIIPESIHVDGDTATARSKWMFVVTGEDRRPVPVYLGHYEDTLARTKGGWKFKRRVVYGAIPYDNPLGDD